MARKLKCVGVPVYHRLAFEIQNCGRSQYFPVLLLSALCLYLYLSLLYLLAAALSLSSSHSSSLPPPSSSKT